MKARWQPRDRVGRYQLLAQIASGGMAEIWLARQAGLKGFEKVVAIKKMADNLSDDPEFVEMFLDEARLAAQLNHSNIVQILDLGEHAGSYYIAMEFLNGENLATVARAAKTQGKLLPLGLAARIIAQAAEGLEHAHKMTGPGGIPLNIVHRDISPQNILVTYDGQVKVVDFGIAKAASRASRTLGNQLKGKMSYLSPEQARGGVIDARSDVFSLGIVLFEVLTLSRLFVFDDPLQAVSAIGSETALPSARERNPGIPPGLDSICARALAKKVETRYQSARELQIALDEWLKRQEVSPGALEVSLYMRALFPDRLRERTALIESARLGDLTPSGVPEVVAATPPSMPGRTGDGLTAVEPTYVAQRKKVSAVVGGAIAASLVLAGVLYFARTRTVDPPPTPPPALLTVETDPPGAQVTVDGQVRGLAPVKIEGLEVGSHDVVALIEGRPSATRTVQIAQAGERATVFLTLPPPVVVPPLPPEKDKLTKKAGPPVARGMLSIDTEPWTKVFLGDRLLGETPLIQVPVPAGRQRLRLINDEKGVHQSIELEIPPGKITAKKYRF